MAESKSRASFIAAIAMLLVGMTVGFILLGLVYTGPVWVKALVFIIYLFVAGMTIRFSKRYADSLRK